MRTTIDRARVKPLPATDFTLRVGRRRLGKSRQGAERHMPIAVARATACKMGTTRAIQDRSPKQRDRAWGCVAKQRDDRAWSRRTKLEMQNSTCVELQKEARIC